MSIQDIFPLDKWDLKSDSILEGLPPADYELLVRHTKEHLYKKGEFIFKEDTSPAGVYFIQEGKVKKVKLDKDGKEHIVNVARGGELIGYHAVLAEDRYPDAAVALEACRILFVPRSDFLHAVEHSPTFTRRLLKILAHEYSVLSNGLAAASQRSVRERLALQLLLMREKYDGTAQPGEEVAISLSREDLACLVGTARENVVRMLREFKDEGLVAVRGRKIVVLDVPRLADMTHL